MFQHVSSAPPDPILGLTEAYQADGNPQKINLAVGVYKDAQGKTPVLASVKAAEARLVDIEKSKSYLPIDGSAEYGRHVRALMLGADDPRLDDGRTSTAHTPGGTGALRVAADYLHQNHPDATVWISQPTWANHPAIFDAAGVPTAGYPYFDAKANALDLRGLLAAIHGMKPGDVILLHGCCHNPTGVDPTPEQWKKIADALAEAKVLPLIDFAYQGFGTSLEDDAAGLREIAAKRSELLICSSFSKNFGLYNERVGALTVVAATPSQTEAVASQIKVAVRRSYSNPPAHGAAVVSQILGDADLRAQWEQELAEMRRRINEMRSAFEAGLNERSVSLAPDGNGFISQQNGMFTQSGLTSPQVAKLRENHSIYIVGSGRINVAGMTPQNLPKLCDAIAEVVN